MRCRRSNQSNTVATDEVDKEKNTERRDAQDEFHSAAQARAWTEDDFDAEHGLAFDGVGRPAR
jgi:hypothetical protein